VASPSKAERVYTELRGDILAGRLQPGERLPYAELCERYGTSMGVLRETLLRLAEQGLARGEFQQGFQVTPLSTTDLLELTEARLVLEPLTLRQAIANGDVEWEVRIIASHHRLSRASPYDAADPDQLSDLWVAVHADFHEALLSGCTNKRLKSMTTALRDSAELYRRWSLPFGHESSSREVEVEHSDIIDAVVSRNADRAVGLLISHIERTTSMLLASSDEDNRVGVGDVAGEPRK
jgi:DNA-binding GntR family transcriptional regulator